MTAHATTINALLDTMHADDREDYADAIATLRTILTVGARTLCLTKETRTPTETDPSDEWYELDAEEQYDTTYELDDEVDLTTVTTPTQLMDLLNEIDYWDREGAVIAYPDVDYGDLYMDPYTGVLTRSYVYPSRY